MRHTVHGKPAAPVLGALLLAALSYALAQTTIAPAIPAIAEDYDTTSGTAAWLLTGYLLSASIATPLAGKLGDVRGKGRVLTVVLVLFSVGSAICALGSSIEVLIAGRIVQGVGGGVFPLAFGIINDELPAERRAVAIGLISATFGIGGGIGLPLAGLIVDHADISLLFWIGLLALPAAAATWLFVPASPPRAHVRIDWTGAAVLSGGLTAVLLAITRANAWGWTSPAFAALLAGGLALLVAFVAIELRVPDPLVDMRVLRGRTLLSTNGAGFLIGFAMFGSFLLTPQFVQAPEATGYGFGLSVTSAGLVMLPSAATMLVAGPLAGHFGTRFGFRTVLAAGAILSFLSFVLLVLAHGSTVDFMAAGVLIGCGLSFAFASMANIIVGAVDRREVGIATGLNTIMRTVGGAFGAAVVTALLTGETIGGSATPTEGAYTDAFILAAAGSLLALTAVLTIPRRGRPRRRPEVAAAPA